MALPCNCLKIHPIAVFLLLLELALLHPLGFLKQVAGSQFLTLGPFAVECHLDEVTAALHPALRHTPTACFLMGSAGMT